MSHPDSIAEYFHDRTKYSPENISSAAGMMQGPQPDPFKTYRVGSEIDLKPYLTEEKAVDPTSLQDRSWVRLSHFLINVYGLTARLNTPAGQMFYLR
jgi:hypothetical protein